MTREEIEQIIRENIRTNGRGEITARVMAGVLQSFILYTDTQTEDFAELCRQLAAAFNALVVEMEGRFETKAEALEAAMEAFCSDLLNNHFIPWAEGLAGSLSDKMDLTKEAADAAKAAALEAKAASLDAKTAAGDAKDAALDAKAGSILAAEKSTAAKAAIDSAADGIAEALLIIREGNTDGPVNYEGMPVLFFDYDGRIVIGYTVEDFLALEAMPANPEHDGLTAQGWNWDFEDAQDYVRKYGILRVGQMYATADDKLHLTIVLTKNLTFTFSAVDGTVDWGDGSALEVVTNGGSHTYAKAGSYEVTVDVQSIGTQAFWARKEIVFAAFPQGIEKINSNLFNGCAGLKTVILPSSVWYIGGDAFTVCNLDFIILPISFRQTTSNFFDAKVKNVVFNGRLSSIENSFANRTGIKEAIIPGQVYTIGNNAFLQCSGLTKVVIPDTVSNIKTQAFAANYALDVECYPVTPPTLGSLVFSSDIQNPARIFVPDEAVEDYKAATNWSAYADIIFPISEKF